MAKRHDYRVFRAPAHEEAIASQLNDLDEQGYHLVASLPIGTDSYVVTRAEVKPKPSEQDSEPGD